MTLTELLEFRKSADALEMLLTEEQQSLLEARMAEQITDLSAVIKSALHPILALVNESMTIQINHEPGNELIVNITKFPIQTNQEVHTTETQYKSRVGQRKGETHQLQVCFPDGTCICEQKSRETFIKALQKIGLERVQTLNIYHSGYNLVSDEKRPEKKPNKWQDFVDGKYIYTKLNNDSKIADLDKISQSYNLGLVISQIE